MVWRGSSEDFNRKEKVAHWDLIDLVDDGLPVVSIFVSRLRLRESAHQG